MKNKFEVRGKIVAIFLDRKDGTTIETIIDLDDLSMVQEFDQIMSTVELQPITAEPTLGEVWENIEANLAIAKKKYIEQADKEFRAQLLQLVLAVTNNQGI